MDKACARVADGARLPTIFQPSLVDSRLELLSHRVNTNKLLIVVKNIAWSPPTALFMRCVVASPRRHQYSSVPTRRPTPHNVPL